MWDLGALTIAQQATQGVYADAMAGYIEWLAPKAPDLVRVLSQQLVEWRQVLTRGGEHARIPESLAHLCLGLENLLQWGREVGGVSDNEFGKLWQRCSDSARHAGPLAGRRGGGAAGNARLPAGALRAARNGRRAASRLRAPQRTAAAEVMSSGGRMDAAI